MRRRNLSRMIAGLLFGEKAPPVGHEFYGNQWTGGGGGEGESAGRAGRGSAARFSEKVGAEIEAEKETRLAQRKELEAQMETTCAEMEAAMARGDASEAERLANKLDTELGPALSETYGNTLHAQAVVQQALREEIGITAPTSIAYDNGLTGGSLPSGIQDGISYLPTIVSADVLPAGEVAIGKMSGDREHCDYEGNIWLGEKTGTATFIHEMGHAIEFRNPAVHEQALAFLRQRTAGEDVVKMRDAAGPFWRGYDDHEMTRPDKFPDPYCGKDYGDRATEIVSMGMQYLYQDPYDFAKTDPEYFDFMMGILRSK